MELFKSHTCYFELREVGSALQPCIYIHRQPEMELISHYFDKYELIVEGYKIVLRFYCENYFYEFIKENNITLRFQPTLDLIKKTLYFVKKVQNESV